MNHITAHLATLTLLLTFTPTATASSPTLKWTRQLGTAYDAHSTDVSTDSAGNSYITGTINGDLEGNGNTNTGTDAFLAKYDTNGNLTWTKQLYTSGNDRAYSVSTDNTGNTYITGINDGRHYDAFLAKYNVNGNMTWTKQLGVSDFAVSPDASIDSSGSGVSTDNAGNMYITGHLKIANTDGTDAFLAKYDKNSNLAWTKRLGTSSNEFSHSVSTDYAGNTYITGSTKGNLEGNVNNGRYDAFLAKYDKNGNIAWTKQLGTPSDDFSTAVSTDDAGNSYITGYTFGSLDGTNNGIADAFLAKYDANGNMIWTKQLGASGKDISTSISTDSAGNSYITGRTEAELGENGNTDAFLSLIDTQGNLIWTEQFGSSEFTTGEGISIDNSGNVFVSGFTYDSLNGNRDAFLTKFSIPEPTTLALLSLPLLTLTKRRKNKI